MRKLFLVFAVLLVVMPLGLWLVARQLLASDLMRSTLERELSARLGRPVRVGSASAAVFPRIAVDLRDVTIGDAPPVRIARILVATGVQSLITRPAAGVSLGRLDFRGIALGRGKEMLTLDVDAALNGDRLDVSSLTARGRTSRMQASGSITSLARLEGAFTVTADPLDLDELVAVEGAIAPERAARGGPTRPMHIVLGLTAPHGQFAGHTFSSLSTKADLVPGGVTLDALSFQIFGGVFKGRVTVDTTGVAPAIRLSGQASGVDLAQAMKTTGSPGGLTGRLAASLTVQAGGADATALLRSARGTVTATVADGTVPHLDIIRRVVLAFGKPSGAPAEGSGTAFHTLSGTFLLANAGVTSENLALTSRDLDLRGRGALRLDSGAVDARADVVLSRELTAQAGSDLRRYAQQDGRVIVPATVSGTLEAPSVFVDVAAAARRALGNELQRRATDFLGGLFKKKKGGG